MEIVLSKSKYILRYLLLKIQSNQITIGEKMPSEGELKIKFNCNRHTVGSVFNELRKRRLVKFFWGKGNFLVKTFKNDIKFSNYVFYNNYRNKQFQINDLPLKLLELLNMVSEHEASKVIFYNDEIRVGEQYAFISKEIYNKVKNEIFNSNIIEVLTLYGITILDVKKEIIFINNEGQFPIKDKTIVCIKMRLFDEDGQEMMAIIHLASLKYMNINSKSIPIQ